jgi:hypothetical protein
MLFCVAGGGGGATSNYKAEELSILEDQLAVREKAVIVAEKNAAAISSVSMNLKQAQAKMMRQSLGRRQAVLGGDDISAAASGDSRHVLDKLLEQEERDQTELALPLLNPHARPSAVAESCQEDSKRKATSCSISVPAIAPASPAALLQPHSACKPQHVLSMESAQNIVSAVVQLGFSLSDQETFTAVLVEKVIANHPQGSWG